MQQLFGLANAGIRTLSRSLSSDEVNLPEYYELLTTREVELDVDVQSLLAEDDRQSRLQEDIQELLKRHPDKQHRPPLFGIPFGVKDIFHVDGFLTHAGSSCPQNCSPAMSLLQCRG